MSRKKHRLKAWETVEGRREIAPSLELEIVFVVADLLVRNDPGANDCENKQRYDG
jgi:hypothetical protein